MAHAVVGARSLFQDYNYLFDRLFGKPYKKKTTKPDKGTKIKILGINVPHFLKVRDFRIFCGKIS